MPRIKVTHRMLALICVMYLIIYIDRSNIGTAATAIRGELKLGNAELGLVFSAFSYPYAAMVLFGGYVADRFGARLTFFACTAVFSIATILTGFAGGLTTLLLARALLGLGEAPALSTATRAMTNWLPRERWGFGQGITHSFARIGTALTPPLVAAIMTASSWRTSFVVVGGVSLAVSGAWYAFFRDVPAEHPAITRAELSRLDAPPPPKRAGIPVRRLALRFLPLILTFFCYGWTLWVYLNWLPSFFSQSFGLNLQSTALFTSGILLGGVVGDSLGGLLSDWLFERTGNLRVARSYVIVTSFGLAFLSLLAVLLSRDLVTVAVALTLAFFLMEIAVAPLWLVTMDVAPRYSGTAGGYLSVGFAIAGVLSPITFGVIVDRTGNWQLPFSASLGLLLVGAVAAFWLKPDEPFREADASPRVTAARTAAAS